MSFPKKERNEGTAAHGKNVFQDTGVLHGCVKGATLTAAGCEAERYAEMTPWEPCGLCSGIWVLSSVWYETGLIRFLF